jgi:hypothetical protein
MTSFLARLLENQIFTPKSQIELRIIRIKVGGGAGKLSKAIQNPLDHGVRM